MRTYILPKARTESLLEQNLQKETLIYDLTIDKAFNLNETLSVVYKACGQSLTFDELKRTSKFTDDFIYLALDELKRNNLLAGNYVSPFANTNRRDVIKKVGLATMLALPLIIGLVAPRSANAASGDGFNQAGLGAGCRNQSDCQPGLSCAFVSTTGDDACCAVIGSNLVLPGGSFVSDESAPTFELRSPDEPSYNANACQEFITCCSGATPSGGCTYVPLSDELYEGKLFTRKDCNCYC
jgi:hypothetical protein